MFENIDLVRFLESVESEVGLLTIPSSYIEGQLQVQFNNQQRMADESASVVLSDGEEQKPLSEKEWQEKLQSKWRNNFNLMLSHLIELDPDNREWRDEQKQFGESGRITPKKFSYLWEQRQKISEQKSRRLLEQREIRTRLCQALQTTPNDSFEIAKVITPLLIEMNTAGIISIPIIPVHFASITLVIARMGVTGLCSDNKKKADDKNN